MLKSTNLVNKICTHNSSGNAAGIGGGFMRGAKQDIFDSLCNEATDTLKSGLPMPPSDEQTLMVLLENIGASNGEISVSDHLAELIIEAKYADDNSPLWNLRNQLNDMGYL